MQKLKYSLNLTLTQDEYNALVEAVSKYRETVWKHLSKTDDDRNRDFWAPIFRSVNTLDNKLDDDLTVL